MPGSTLMYGSNFWIDTDRPRETSSWPIDAAAMPLPSEETTPPVTKMNLVVERLRVVGHLSLERHLIARSGGTRLTPPPAAPRRDVARRRRRSRRRASGTAPPPRRPPRAARPSARVTSPPRQLLDPEVPVGQRRDLRQVGDAEHLALGAERAQALADRPRRLAADAGVDLVEDQRRGTRPRRHRHQRQHHARQLAARRALAQRRRGHARVGRQQELDALGARTARSPPAARARPRRSRPPSPAPPAPRAPAWPASGPPPPAHC